jgi:hypothetical protein
VKGGWTNSTMQSLIICIPHAILLGSEIKVDEIGEACGTYGCKDTFIHGFGGET